MLFGHGHFRRAVGARWVGLPVSGGASLLLGTAAPSILGLFGLGFLFATVAAAFETFLATWLALLITAGILFATAGLLGLTALSLLRRAAPPLPEQAIEEARLTSEALRR